MKRIFVGLLLIFTFLISPFLVHDSAHAQNINEVVITAERMYYRNGDWYAVFAARTTEGDLLSSQEIYWKHTQRVLTPAHKTRWVRWSKWDKSNSFYTVRLQGFPGDDVSVWMKYTPVDRRWVYEGGYIITIPEKVP